MYSREGSGRPIWLALVPEILGVAPVDFDRAAISGLCLDHVPAAAAKLVDSRLGHVFTQPICHTHHFRSLLGLASRKIVASNASQVPGDLEVVADNGPVLVLAISMVGVPFLIEFLVDKRNIRIRIDELITIRWAVRSRIRRQVSRKAESSCSHPWEEDQCENQIDQVGWEVVAD